MKKELFIFCLCLFLIGCTPQSPSEDQESRFVSDQHGFSFIHPPDWDVRTNDLPNRWAANAPNGDTLVFTVNNAEDADLEVLGVNQLLRDRFPGSEVVNITSEDFTELAKILQIRTFNDHQFYTYAINFNDKQRQALVSGTVCNSKEITLVLVATDFSVDQSKFTYQNLLNSFVCNEN